MFFKASPPLCLSFLVALTACGSGSATSTSSTSSGGTSSGGPSDPVALPGGGAVPAVSCGDENVTSASGSWDVISSKPGSGQGTATITIDSGSFSFKQGQSLLAFSVSGATMALTWTTSSKQAAIAVTHGGDALATGLLPLAVGGSWSFASTTGGSETCTALLNASSLNTTCTKVSSPFGRLDGTAIGLRQEKKSSIFGELGGLWHFTGSGGSDVIDVTVSGNVFTAVVNGGGDARHGGWVTVKACNGTAAGKLSNGTELAATRR